MSYQPVEYTHFTGLNLRDDPQEVSGDQALDLLNTVPNDRGRLSVRSGYDNFSTATGSKRFGVLSAFELDGVPQLIAGTQDAADTELTIRVLNASGGTIASQNITLIAGTATVTSIARLGDNSYNEYAFIANSVPSVPTRWDGAAFAAGTGVPAARYLAVSPNSNRLVTAGEQSNIARVAFSDPGTPQTFTVGNFVELDPGDGERIRQLVRFRDVLIAFKESKFYTFYSESTDATGLPIFNYRAVNTGVGCTGAATVGPDAVYFLNGRGVYRTSGNDPQLISGILDPLFTGSSMPAYLGSAVNQSQISKASMAWVDERLYVAVPTGSSTFNDRLLVWDSQVGEWTVWDIPAAGLCGFAPAGTSLVHFSYATGSNHVGQISPSFTTDDGSTISWRWQSGFYDLDLPGQEKVVRYSSLHGTGTPTLQVAVDHGSVDTGSAVTLGSSPAIDEGFQDIDRAGLLLSHKLSGTGQATVHRLTHYLSHVRAVGLRSA